MTLVHRIRFYQQLAVLARAGVPLRASLQRMEKKIPGPEIGTLARQIEQGQPIGGAFTAAGFSPFECHLVAAGERSAQLETVFDRLAQFWTREQHLFQALTRQLYYPIVLLHLSVLVLAVIHFSQGIPAMVETLVTGLVVLYVLGGTIYLLARVTWRSAAAQRFWLFVPFVGAALKSAYAYRWITALRLEFAAGVPFPDAVSDAWLASGYLDSKARAHEGESGLRSGEELSSLVQRWRQLPRDWIDFVETGEISGEYEAMFTNMETESARNWTLAQDRMTEWVPKILTFVLLIVVGCMIGRAYFNVLVAPIQQAEKVIDSQ
jgi:type II secretory pathway component PulF